MVFVKAETALNDKGKLKKGYKKFMVRGAARYMTDNTVITPAKKTIVKSKSSDLDKQKKALLKTPKCKSDKKRVGKPNPVSKAKKCVVPVADKEMA